MSRRKFFRARSRRRRGATPYVALLRPGIGLWRRADVKMRYRRTAGPVHRTRDIRAMTSCEIGLEAHDAARAFAREGGEIVDGFPLRRQVGEEIARVPRPRAVVAM